MAGKAERPGAPGREPGPRYGWPGPEAPITFLRFSALGADLAVEAAKVCAVLELGAAHAPTRHGAGLVMRHADGIIPLVDFRSGAEKGKRLPGAPLLVALVCGRRFGIAVDGIHGRIGIAYAEIRMPRDGLARQAPYLTGSVWRDGRELFLIDVDRLLGPAVRTHLLKTG